MSQTGGRALFEGTDSPSFASSTSTVRATVAHECCSISWTRLRDAPEGRDFQRGGRIREARQRARSSGQVHPCRATQAGVQFLKTEQGIALQAINGTRRLNEVMLSGVSNRIAEERHSDLLGRRVVQVRIRSELLASCPSVDAAVGGQKINPEGDCGESPTRFAPVALGTKSSLRRFGTFSTRAPGPQSNSPDQEGGIPSLVPLGTEGATVVAVRRFGKQDFYSLSLQDLARKVASCPKRPR